MEMHLSLEQNLAQQMRLQQVRMIDFSHLMAVPDEVLNVVTGSILHNPEAIEAVLQNKKEEFTAGSDRAKKVQTIYSSLTPSKGDVNKKGGGLIISPDLRTLEGHVRSYTVGITPDVTYMGRKNEKPEVVLSDHLRGTPVLSLLEIDSSMYPETSRLVSQLRNFDGWKRRTLIRAYVILGGVQGEYFEDFNSTKLNVFIQQDLANGLNMNVGTVNRILANRWVEARNISGEQRFFYAKDLFVTKDRLNKLLVLPLLNKIMTEEFERRKAYHDSEISERVHSLARRTIAKYREESNIPNIGDRNNIYRFGDLTQPFEFH